MSLDTKYRPRTYDDVLGQEVAAKILRQIVKAGRGWHSSYLFSGPFGTGKTTLGRILARALLCSEPAEGSPCDQCRSCKELLKRNNSECYTEIDAATNSGKDHIRRILETLDFATFSGNRRLYLFDECFTEETVLYTRDGPRTIRWIVENQYGGDLLSYEVEDKSVVWKRITNWFNLGIRDVLHLSFDNGVELTVTPNQKLWTKNRRWVEAQDLTEEDSLLTSYRKFSWTYGEAHLVKREVVESSAVYDVTTEGTHCFFASSGEHASPVVAHNSHQLSRDALDALLKPMEDTREGGERRLVCIFCTTEPERMRATVGSRCGPAFAIRIAPPQEISNRLAFICKEEGIQYEEEALLRISGGVEGHIRDALKALEMLALQGNVTLENVDTYLGYDLNSLYLQVLEGLGSETLSESFAGLKLLLQKVSPTMIYEQLAKISLLAYKVSVGLENPVSYWDATKLHSLGAQHSGKLLDFSESFASRPRRPTEHMLECDLFLLHRFCQQGAVIPQVPDSRAGILESTSRAPVSIPQVPVGTRPPPGTVAQENGTKVLSHGHRNGNLKGYVTPLGVCVLPEAVNRNRQELPTRRKKQAFNGKITAENFAFLVRQHLEELKDGKTIQFDIPSFSALLRCRLLELRTQPTGNCGSGNRSKQGEADSQGVL